MPTPSTTGRDLIERGRAAVDRGRAVAARPERRPRALALVAVGTAAATGGYLLGRRKGEPDPAAATNGTAPPPAEPAMEVATAVEVSRPQPAGLDEIVPAAGVKA